MNSESNQSHRFRPTVNLLEDRTVPAGNVQAFVQSGVLFVVGDDALNRIRVEEAGSNAAVVRALDSDTTINGQVGGQKFGGIKRGYDVKLNGGDDILELVGVTARRGLRIEGGAGADTIKVVSVTVKGDTDILTGDGNDGLYIAFTKFSKRTAIDLGAGDDLMSQERVKYPKKAVITGAAGTNSIGSLASTYPSDIVVDGFGTRQSTLIPIVPNPDLTPPTTAVTVTTASSTARTFKFTVAFSEDVTGFVQSDVSVTNGTIASFTADSARSYTVNVTPTGSGTVVLTVPAGVAADASGNTNLSGTASALTDLTDSGMVATTSPPSETDPNWVATASGSGLKTWDIREGSGTAITSTGNTVGVFYTGWLTNGTVFDSKRSPDTPASFQLTSLIEGWKEGLIGMKLGGIRRLLVPSSLGYGTAGTTTIPANSTLIFEIKLISVS